MQGEHQGRLGSDPMGYFFRLVDASDDLQIDMGCYSNTRQPMTVTETFPQVFIVFRIVI